ncbi:hypothetical protein [Streptomyces sp. NPDC056690]|uniref:hypothetical protein n=1 Tax=unclassified Streptomyces TaxID=2593676 RepID=UPI00363D0829
MAEGLGLRSYQQATLPFVKVRQYRLKLGCQNGPLLFQPAHAGSTNHRAESHELKICTPLEVLTKALALRTGCDLPCLRPELDDSTRDDQLLSATVAGAAGFQI